jgi:pyruvate kinase
MVKQLNLYTTWVPTVTRDEIHDMVVGGLTGMRLIAKGLPPDQLRAIAENIISIGRSQSADFCLMLDLPGAKPRLSRSFDRHLLKKGDYISFADSNDSKRDETALPMEYLSLYIQNIKRGHSVLIADGTVRLIVTDVRVGKITCHATHDGVLFGGRSVNLPESEVQYQSFVESDYVSLKSVADLPIQAVIISMVSGTGDIKRVRDTLSMFNSSLPIFSKIETAKGVEHCFDISKMSDGLMVGRGDLSMETPLHTLGVSQAITIDAAKTNGKHLIVATGLLASLSHDAPPTIAEVSEISLLIERGVRGFLLGSLVAQRSPGLACQWITKIFNHTIEKKS